jgi:hypothetical protein
MHHKEQLAREPFGRILGAMVHAPAGLDTDQFGTFAGDVPRSLTPRAAARVKARLGMRIAGTRLGLASEGTFNAPFGAAAQNTELFLFLDDILGVEVVDYSTVISPLPAPRTVARVDPALEYAERAGFPGQGIVLTASVGDVLTVRKDFASMDAIAIATAELLATAQSVLVQPDHRAHASPTRAEHIRGLAERMAERLATPCPDCGTPGYGRIGTSAGLPCRDCGNPTGEAAFEIDGCALCPLRIDRPVEQRAADPASCEFCNP